MVDSNIYSVIGIFLTLIGLMGTFFYIHLSNWLQELLKLNSKWEQNKPGTDASQMSAKRECKYELRGLFNHVPILISCMITTFSIIVWRNSSFLLDKFQSDTISSLLHTALDLYMYIYLALTTYILLHGYIIGFSIWKNTRK